MYERKSRTMIIMSLISVLAFTAFIFTGCGNGSASPADTDTVGTAGEPAEAGFKDEELVIQGSDTLLEVSQNWAEAFMNRYPQVSISVTGGGSGTGIAALINKTADFANASREMKESEREEALSAGLDPQEYIVAYDGISVVVNNNNPVIELTIEQISKIFTGEITSWSELGGNDAEIIVSSRDSSSGTYQYFKERVVQLDETLKDNDYTQNALFLASNSEIREEVSSNENAIGYIGLGYMDESVKALGVKADDSAAAVEPSIDSVKSKDYPISRPLYIYSPDTGLTDLEQSFMDFVTGQEGQEIALEIGFVPIK
ncbi:MAG: phosphate ABC transporter substrate-binding protein [Actinobacteria bacterium]|nr:phosphate ABC transporter substrate-binding protein [Actinomycetota bacterium]